MAFLVALPCCQLSSLQPTTYTWLPQLWLLPDLSHSLSHQDLLQQGNLPRPSPMHTHIEKGEEVSTKLQWFYMSLLLQPSCVHYSSVHGILPSQCHWCVLSSLLPVTVSALKQSGFKGHTLNTLPFFHPPRSALHFACLSFGYGFHSS